MVAEAGAAGRALPDRLQRPARQPGRDRASLGDPIEALDPRAGGAGLALPHCAHAAPAAGRSGRAPLGPPRVLLAEPPNRCGKGSPAMRS